MSEYRVDEAFAIVPGWLIEAKVSDRAVRLYAILSWMRDYGTDMATVGRKMLASKLGCSNDSLDRAKAELEEAEAITVERMRGENGGIERNVYTIHRVPPSRTGAASASSRTGAASPTGAARSPLMDESSSSSTPQVLDASHVRIKSDSTDAWYEIDVDARNGTGTCTCPARRVCKHIRRAREILGRPDAAGRQPGSVGGKRVTVAEHDLCDGILSAFNELSGKRFAGAEWRRAIIGRVREHPDLTLVEHRSAIEFSLEHPWWKGDPSPAVVYGKGSVFDSALNSVRGSGQNGGDDGLSAYDR